MAYKKNQKTEEEWKKIRFQNNLGPQIGGLLHDAVQLAISERADGSTFEERVKYWLDALYDIAEAKKKELTTPQPVDFEAAMAANEQVEKNIEEANNQIQQARAKELEDNLADSYPEQMQERGAEENAKNI